MPIQGIEASKLIAESLTPNTGTKGIEGDSFQNILSDAIGNAQGASKQDDVSAAELLLGDTNQLHNVVLDSEKAQITLDLAIQVRNKVVEAYNEIMRMQL